MSEPTKIVVQLTPSKFVIGSPEEGVFEGLHVPTERWNGWACPLFTREVCNEIAESATGWGEDHPRIYFDGDVLVEVDPNYDADEASQRLSPYDYEGTLMWDLGAYSWTWEAWTDEELAEHAELRAAERNGRHP